MTSPHEALGDTGVERAWAEYSSIIGLARLDKVNGGLDAIGFLHETGRAKAIVEAAVRAQVDEDVRALVETVGLAVSHLEEGHLCPHGTPALLRAALEPFKAVSPTADVEEVER